jgi:hypothetical protein
LCFSEGIGVGEEDSKSLQEKLKSNPFTGLLEEYSSYYKLNKIIENSVHYIAPREIKLPPGHNGKSSSFQYIPVGDVVEAIIRDPDFKPSSPSPEGILYDIKDGSAWKNNKYFRENPEALTGQLYSDALQLENPLGASKGFHKVVNIYFSLVDVPKSLRSKTENIFLLLSVKEKDLKENSCCVYKPLIDDLKKLESGVMMGDKIIKLGIICYSGDNLEAHLVGGFRSSFSSGDICRVCHQQHKDLPDISGISKAPLWTCEEYDSAAENIEPGVRGEFGVSSACFFNELQAFPCVGQMPLDPMHDFMEKVGAFDGMSIIKALILEGKFTITDYNSALKDIKLSDYEATDKPLPVKQTSDKLTGKAMAVALHIRLMPFILWRLCNHDVEESDILDLLILINRIQEVILADKLNVVDVDTFQDLLVEYFAKRKICEEQFPVFIKVTPKYHYLGKRAF